MKDVVFINIHREPKAASKKRRPWKTPNFNLEAELFDDVLNGRKRFPKGMIILPNVPTITCILAEGKIIAKSSKWIVAKNITDKTYWRYYYSDMIPFTNEGCTYSQFVEKERKHNEYEFR